MTIKIYPSLLPGEPVEVHEWAGTIGAWFESKDIDYLAEETQPVTISVNSVTVPVEGWSDAVVGASDMVDIRLLPHGDVFKSLGNIIGKIFNAVFGWLTPGSGGSSQRDPGQGSRLETSQAKANSAKLGDVVPELAGRFRRFPDYLTPPRRRFFNLREQWLEFHACVGPGEYQILPNDVKVGDTPFSGLGGDGVYGIYRPGEDVSSTSTHEHWHTVSEVGGTSSGTAGLVLNTELANRTHTPAPQYIFSGVTVSIPSGTGSFPPGWGPGTVVSVLLARSLVYTVSRVSGVGSANIFAGDFAHMLPLANGAAVSVSGAGLSGSYLVQAVSLNSQGAGSLQLWTLPIPQSESSPGQASEPVISVQPGNHTLTTDAGARPYSLIAASEDFISVSGGPFPAITSPAVIQYSGGLVYGEWTSVFAACPDAETTNLIEVDFFFPSGLAFIDNEAGLQARTVRAEVQYRDIASSGAYTSVMKIYTQNTLDQIGFTEQISVPNIRPEVRVRRVGAASTSTQVQDTIHWYGLKSRLPTRTAYPKWTTMSVRIRSGGRLAAQSENQINVIATRILPTLQADRSWSAPQPTRDITAFSKYIASTIGYTDDDLEMAEFLRLNDIWQGRGETFDYVFDETTVKEALNTAFGAGMAELTVDDGKIKPVRDGVRTQFEHSYSPQNMTGPLRRAFRAPKHDDADGVEVEYIDGNTWSKSVVRCFLPGDQGFKIAKIKVDGVVNRTTAWRIGMRHRRALRFRNWEYSFSTELDALNSGYMSYVPLYDDIPGYGQSAILEGIESVASGAMLHVSEPLNWETGQSHVVAYRRPDGTLAGPWIAAPGVDDYSVIANIPQPWPVVTLKMEPAHVYFGTAERWTFPALITDIKPQGLESVSVSATNYDARVYADDNNFPPI